MMHSHMLILAVVIAYLSRFPSQWLLHTTRHWSSRWARTLSAFVVPPLFVLTTAVAVVMMGPICSLRWEGWLSFGMALLFVLAAVGSWGYLSWLAVVLQRQLRQYPMQPIKTPSHTVFGRVTEMASVFSAQVGFWSSDLVVSKGLLAKLDDVHLEAVLAHEAGHVHYRDTFWFFWLGGLRRCTGWLPYTDELWQELLLLREVRADRWATQSVDRVVLAEALMKVITAPAMMEDSICVGFSCAMPRSCLAQRIDALLADDEIALPSMSQFWPKHWIAISLSLTPLLTVPFHH